jgi:hypothetical protein
MPKASTVGSITGAVVLVCLVVGIYILFFSQDRGGAGVDGRHGRDGAGGVPGPPGLDGPMAPPGPKGDRGTRGVAGTCSVHTVRYIQTNKKTRVHFCRVGDMVSVNWSDVEMRGVDVLFLNIPAQFKPLFGDTGLHRYTPMSEGREFIPAESYTVKVMMTPDTTTEQLRFTSPNGFATLKIGFGSMSYIAEKM